MEYQIGDFSKIISISVKTLRYYHEINLICPCRIDSESGYRFYDDSCINKAQRIKILKALDFNLKEIKNIIEKYEEDDDLSMIMKLKLIETKTKINEYRQIQKTLELIISNQRKTSMKNNEDIIIKKVDDILIASIRTKDKYSNVGMYMSKISKQYSKVICGKPFSLYYDTEYKEDGVDMEICFPVKQQIDNNGVTTRILKGGQVLSVFHKGAYEEIGEAYKSLLYYINKNSIKISMPTREIYIKGPGMIFEGKPQKYLTELQMIISD